MDNLYTSLGAGGAVLLIAAWVIRFVGTKVWSLVELQQQVITTHIVRSNEVLVKLTNSIDSNTKAIETAALAAHTAAEAAREAAIQAALIVASKHP